MQNKPVVALDKFTNNRIVFFLRSFADWDFIASEVGFFISHTVCFIFGFYFAFDSFLPAFLGSDPLFHITQPVVGFLGNTLGFVVILFVLRIFSSKGVFSLGTKSTKKAVSSPSMPDVGDYDPRQVRM